MLNSTFFGSTSTNFNSAGCFLYNKEVIIAFKPTDLPWPVAPATNTCGILQRSNIKTSFVMVLPNTIGRSYLDSWNFLLPITLCPETIFGFLFGTSIPIVPLPGIGAMIRIPSAERLNAISSSKPRILEIRTPCSGVISYRVTVGPTVALIVLISIPKLRNVLMIRSLFAFCSSMSIVGSSFSKCFIRSIVGKR